LERSLRSGDASGHCHRALLAIPVIPLYAYGHSALTLGIGAVLMQFMVQGAWAWCRPISRVVAGPVRPRRRASLPTGRLITSWNGKAQALAAEQRATIRRLAITVIVVALSLTGLALLDAKRRAQMTETDAKIRAYADTTNQLPRARMCLVWRLRLRTRRATGRFTSHPAHTA